MSLLFETMLAMQSFTALLLIKASDTLQHAAFFRDIMQPNSR
jgi:hypothetical protein